MAEVVRMWKIINQENLVEIKRSKLNLEERIESWLEKDISIISSEIMIIGRQEKTDGMDL